MTSIVLAIMPVMEAPGFGDQPMEVDSTTLTTIAGFLDDAGGPLLGHASSLQTVPDAGTSTGAVADAMTALATAVAGLSGHIGELASSTGVAGTTYKTTDDGSGHNIRAVPR